MRLSAVASPPDRLPVAGRAERIISCPGCGGPSVYAASNPARPFCSERCRSNDLGAWATEGYRVAARSEPDDEGEDGLLPPPP